MKRSKFLALLLTFALLGTLLLPTAGFAAGLTSNYVDREVNVGDKESEATFGSLYIKESEDFPNAFSEDETDPSVITITLVDGVEFPSDVVDDEDAEAIFGNSSPTLDYVIQSITDTSVTVEVYSTEADKEKEKLQVDFDNLEIDSDFSGAVEVRVDSLDNAITSGEYVIGNVLGSECTATVVNKKTVAVGDTGVKLGTIRITENAKGAMVDGSEIVITLPDDYEWNEDNDTDGPVILGGSLASAYEDDYDIDDEEITLYFSESGLDYRGILDITPVVDIPYDAEPGDCEVEVEGDGDLDMNSVDLVLAKVEDFGNEVSIEKVKEFFAGQYDKELAEITVEQNTEDSINSGRYIVAELSSNAKFIYDREDIDEDDSKLKLGDFPCTEISDNKIVWKTTDDVEDDTEFSIDKLRIALNLSQPGDVTMKFSGSAGVEGELVVAKSLAPVTATVENATEVKIGVQAQTVGDVIIKEAGAEAIDEDGPKTLLLKAPDGVSFASRPTAEVIEGDLKLDNSNLVKFRDDNGDGMYDVVLVETDKVSKNASAVKFSNIKLNVDRSYPEGPLTLRVGGSAIVDADAADMFNSSWAASVAAATVVTPAPDQENGSAMFLVGNNFYNLNGQMKMMDVAPYIKNGRTYVPVRYLAYVCGLKDENIGWDEASQTVTLTKGDTVVTMMVGSTTLTAGETTTTMDVAPEVVNGRTMLPARYVAEAFGGTVTWNADTNAVGIEF
ncbi:hypothetical protein DCCM_4747 [Desulfocucumis palustris]|uniref:Copper amine oxidase-like N-terminal domain-containing protein n=1 Tax=Desulfocucumis palustris TaxID=1898651 RepID=A0A2L2XHA7_9FIRM|nr:copper amine oxidase N-terminal domain-containing protein [Desulfocucumis palustris]GBF35618.1 hypothetical protein DCCM_4747 [Desulfocucumis palustris]